MDTILYFAVCRGDVETCRRCIERNTNISYRYRAGRSLLHEAIMYNHLECAKLLIDAGIDINGKDDGLNTPLHNAKSYEAIKFLLDNGAKINVKNHCDATPLHFIVMCATPECIGLLLQFKIDIDSQDSEGCTPLHVANKYDRTENILFLLHNGANPHLTDNLGNTPEDIAFKFNSINTIKILQYGQHRNIKRAIK